MNKIIFLFVALVTLGCALKNPPPRNSRFSADYSEFEKADFHADTWVYRHHEIRVADYSKFMVEPVKIYDNPASSIKKEDRSDYDKSAERIRQKAIAVMKPRYTMVQEPEPGVLLLQYTITDIKPVVHLTSPDGVAYTQVDTALKGSKLELDCVDALMGERVFSITTLYGGNDYLAYEDKSLLPNIEKAFDDWTVFLKGMLDRAVDSRSTHPSK